MEGVFNVRLVMFWVVMVDPLFYGCYWLILNQPLNRFCRFGYFLERVKKANQSWLLKKNQKSEIDSANWSALIVKQLLISALDESTQS
jgi:hypothetical protein